MREIFFRGKRVDNVEWVEGSLLLPTTDNLKTLIIAWNGTRFEVDPSTVGQFTGLLDKNGKKIFEGDKVILKDSVFMGYFDSGQPDNPDEKYEDFISEIFFEDGMFCVNEPNTVTSAWIGYNGLKDIEVIGNIHNQEP